MANNVSVSLGLRDLLTSPLRTVMAGVRGQINGIGDTSQLVSGSIGGMTTGFVGLATAIGASALALVGFKDGIGKAASMETLMITTAGDVSNLVGTTYSQALASVKDIQREIVTMAAALPGETAGFSAIANSITASIALGSKGNLKQMKDDVVDVTRTLGLLAATKNVDMNLAASASNKFVSGSASISELFSVNDVFQKNPLFKVYLNEQLGALGKTSKDWQSLDQEVRNKVIVAAGKRAYTTETLKKFDGTADSLIQSIKTSLFDQQVGIFGFLRDIKELDGKNALSRVAVFLSSVQTVATSLGKAGFNFDPMLQIGYSLNYLSDVLYSVNLGITKGDWRSVKQMLSGMWKGIRTIPTTLADGINVGIGFLKNIDWTQLAGYIAEGLDALTAGIKTVNWGDLGTGLGKGIMDILLDEKLGKSLEASVTAALQGFADAIGGALKGAVKSFINPTGAAAKESRSWSDNINSFFGINKQMPTDGALPEGAKALPKLQSNNSNTSNQQVAFAPVINISGNVSDPNQMADYIMTAFNSKFTEYQQTILT